MRRSRPARIAEIFLVMLIGAGVAGMGYLLFTDRFLFGLVLGAAIFFAPVLAGLAAVFSTEPLPPPREEPPRQVPPPPPRDTLTPLIVGLALGWWLGGGSGDSDDC